ncbi:hypothetical protein [Dyella mobilis]|uniref:Secreted protein n=1 Tax=Dyella mobilis TaxID=1849582 RepID=A0ABS2KJ05_9GAMM|nr:hypothetical protein [Dyella mobilis]MBM7131136.1 hypothetical protein [Dyella mobilis]GLQ98930.1 hypothetical protein GCM10007863_33500 [Dyella mobilis]
MQQKLKFALLAGLVGAACMPALVAAQDASAYAQSGDEAVGPIESVAREAWREDVAAIATPAEGCFHATYPSIVWRQVGCNVVTPREHPVLRRAAFGAAQTTGNGADYALKAAGHISQTVGTFPSVKGVTSEKGVGVAAFGGGGILGPNEYTLQINSNADSSTAACKGHSGCVIWQQFIYSPDYSVQGEAAVFMQYWLINYGGSSCPSGWGSDGQGDCYRNSAATTAPDVPITKLASLKLSGSVVSGGKDTVIFTDGTEAYSSSGKDSVTDLAGVWNESEFNVVGNAGGSEADFNSGSSVGVKVAVSDGSKTAPTCAKDAGTTGETNNLNLGSCTTASGTTPSIQFTESN